MQNSAPVITVELKVLDKEFWSNYPLMSYASNGAAAFDLRTNIKEPIEVPPGKSIMVGTGLALWLGQPGLALMLLPRSGLGSKGLILGNGTGLIDSDYQGELMVSLYNRNLDEPFLVNPGDRIAQAMAVPVYQLNPSVVEQFSNETERGNGGFGHSGVA